MGRSSDSAVCRECPPDSVSQGVLGAGERCVMSCSLGQRPLGSNTCAECKGVAGTYANSSVKRDPADPSTWAAPGCASCPSGKRADSETGAVCLPCVPGQFASSTRSASCDVCPAGSYSAGFESTGCAPCPTSGYCSSPGAGDAALAFTPCAQPEPNPTACTLSPQSRTKFPLAGAPMAHFQAPLVSAMPRSAHRALQATTAVATSEATALCPSSAHAATTVLKVPQNHLPVKVADTGARGVWQQQRARAYASVAPFAPWARRRHCRAKRGRTPTGQTSAALSTAH